MRTNIATAYACFVIMLNTLPLILFVLALCTDIGKCAPSLLSGGRASVDLSHRAILEPIGKKCTMSVSSDYPNREMRLTIVNIR
jgi:hypothetical protein